MCGRYTVKASTDQMEEAFQTSSKLSYQSIENYNAAPSQNLPVICLENDQKIVTEMEWGLLPSWVKDKADFKRPINARCESVLDKNMFRKSYMHQRCLIPASGFYEWDDKTKPKQPYYFHLPNQALFAFAGIWAVWKGEGSSPILSYAILTKEANTSVKEVHGRMPIIVSEEDYDTWLYEGGMHLFAQEGPGLNSYMVDRAAFSP